MNIRLSFIALAISVLLLGCLQPYPEEVNQTDIPEEKDGQDIEEPKTNITEPINGSTQDVNETPELNQTNETVEPTEPTIPKTNLTISELLADQLDGIESPKGGPYSTVKYQWTSEAIDADPTAIVINPTYQIMFDDKAEENLAGFGFIAYKSTSGAETAKGYAIVIDKSTTLDSKLIGEFEIDFNVPGLEKKLFNSQITSKEEMQDKNGKSIIIYGFESNNVK